MNTLFELQIQEYKLQQHKGSVKYFTTEDERKDKQWYTLRDRQMQRITCRNKGNRSKAKERTMLCEKLTRVLLLQATDMAQTVHPRTHILFWIGCQIISSDLYHTICTHHFIKELKLHHHIVNTLLVFFFFCVPQPTLKRPPHWWDFCIRCQAVTFQLWVWTMLGVFLYLVFTNMWCQHQDLYSLRHETHA